MARNVARKYGRENVAQGIEAVNAQRRIKMGFKRKSGSKEFPARYPGFVIVYDTLEEGKVKIDWEAMKALGNYDENSIKLAQQKQLNAPNGTLPMTLNFRIRRDAIWSGDHWEYPGLYSESHQMWNKLGRQCYGDGNRATWKNKDCTTQQVVCNPVGKTGCAANDFCQNSVEGDCKPLSRVALSLFAVKDGKPQPLSREIGMDGVYQLDTTSEYNAISFLNELDAVSDVLADHEHGIARIRNICGKLTFSIVKRRKPDGGAVATCSVKMVIDEESVRRRQEEMLNERLLVDRREERKLAIVASTPRRALPAPKEEGVQVEEVFTPEIISEIDDEPEPPFWATCEINTLAEALAEYASACEGDKQFQVTGGVVTLASFKQVPDRVQDYEATIREVCRQASSDVEFFLPKE